MVKRQDGINGSDRNLDTNQYATKASEKKLKGTESFVFIWTIPWEYPYILDKLGSNFKIESTINNGYPILINIDQSKQ